MHTIPALFLAGLLLAGPAPAPEAGPDARAARLQAIPAEMPLPGLDLRLINLHKTQLTILDETAGRPRAEIVERLVRETYTPFKDFWSSHLGGEEEFRKWAETRLLAEDHPVRKRVDQVLALDLPAVFARVVPRFVELTGRKPSGPWYALFGPALTDMGSTGNARMLIDFSNIEPRADEIEFRLPHELHHQVMDRLGPDPDEGTVLHRAFKEGFASWFNHLYWGGRETPARNLYYTEEEWAWCLAHEARIFEFIQPYLFSKEWEHVMSFAARNAKPYPGGPGALGYFVGYRIVEAYTAKHGEGSWKDLFDLSAREALARSGYAPKAAP